jgi:hypothetical protein
MAEACVTGDPALPAFGIRAGTAQRRAACRAMEVAHSAAAGRRFATLQYIESRRFTALFHPLRGDRRGTHPVPRVDDSQHSSLPDGILRFSERAGYDGG